MAAETPRGFSGGQDEDDGKDRATQLELKNNELAIQNKMNEVEQLASKCGHPITLNSSSDVDGFLKEFQQLFSAGEPVEGTLRCLHELGDLNRTRYRLISRQRKASDSIHYIDFRRQKLSNGLDNTSGRRFHVVIVGINKYDDPATPALQGCVNDALLFHDYFIHDLFVPADQITTLLSSTGKEVPSPLNTLRPTRENILNALYGLHNNHNLKPDDSIIIFYAGHGQSYPAKDAGYECTSLNTGSIEAISPVDRNTSLMFNSDGTEEIVVDISDREINVILGEIAKKCPNITLILDCCYAGGATRGTRPTSNKVYLTPRHCDPIPSAIRSMFEAADSNAVPLSPHRPRTVGPEFRPNMKSHVLLAAAKDGQEAYEYTDTTTEARQGFFTSALLSALRSPLGRDTKTTYIELIGSLKMPEYQTAFVVGRKEEKLWFV
ncbi:caspase domain-containing protein [Rhodocollybia butyracea]|uniref:Caspase domain-containing protein n=1 Tax=Rhodocollybia butyracea TaxID=206335 RepID=A0A9P5PQL8_9AGAR|nr:caspase domain-containing protein [Rhodocollybia butyracea]